MESEDFLANFSANVSSDTIGATVVTVQSLFKKIMELKPSRDNYHQFRDMLNVMHSHLMEMQSSSSQYHTQVSPAIERCTKQLTAVLEEAKTQFPEVLPSWLGSFSMHSNMESVKMKLEAGFEDLDSILARQYLIRKTALLMQSSITHSNLQAVQPYDPVKEDLRNFSANVSSNTIGATVVTVQSLFKKIVELKHSRDNYHLFRHMLNAMHSHLMEMHRSYSQYHPLVSFAVERCTEQLMQVLEEARTRFPKDLPSLLGSRTLHRNMEDVKMKLEAGLKELDSILARQDLMSKTALLQPPKPLMQSSITQSNLQAVQTYDPVKEDLRTELKHSRDDYHQFCDMLNVMRSHLMEMQSSSSQYHTRFSPAIESCTKQLMAVLEEARTRFPEDIPSLHGSLTLHSNMEDVKVKLEAGFKELDSILASQHRMQSSITQSNLKAFQTYDPVKEDLQKIGKLFTDVYDKFKEGRKRRQIVRKTPTDFITKAEEQFKDCKIDDKLRNTSSSALKVTTKELPDFSVKSDGLSKFKEILLGTASAVTGVVTANEVEEFTSGTLKTMDSAHLIGAGLLVGVFLLEKWEMVSGNKEECLDLLENIAYLVICLYQINQGSTKISQMGDCRLQEIIRECMDTIIDVYDLIWSTLTAAKIKRLFNAKTEKEELAKLKHELDYKYRKLMGQIMIDCSSVPHDFRFPVGLLDEVTKTINQLEWEGHEKALAVVLHGHSGSGKTTLGAAVYVSPYVNTPTGFSDTRCTVVRLFRGMNSFRIMQAQSIIINDLEKSNFKPTSTNEGRNKIRDILQNIPAFIYIDNLEGDEELRELLPRGLYKAKKLRLLLTCRDYTHCMSLKLSKPPVFHRIKPLSEEAATEFICEHLGKEAWFNTIISKEIADMCSGIPQLLNEVVSDLRTKGEGGLEIVKDEHKYCSGRFGESLVDMLGLKELKDEEREALLDILYFFKQENWDEVKRIIRADILDKLACKSLVEKTHQEAIKIDDVLSYITKEEARRTRLTNEQQIQEFLKAEHDPHRLEGMKNIKGISVPSTMGTVDIPHILLDHMQGSVRVLRLGMKGMITGECKKRFEKLIYLDCQPFIHLETPKLRCLRLCGDFPDTEVNLSTFWLAKFEDLQELREIQISGYPLKTLPNGLDLLKELQVLKLSCCHDFKDLGSGFFHLSQKIKLFLCDHLKSRMEHIITGLNYVNLSSM